MFYGQIDPRWKDHLLGSSKITIGQAGCYITTFANILNIAGDLVTPASLNDRFLAQNKFVDEDEMTDNDIDGMGGTQYAGTQYYPGPADLNFPQDPLSEQYAIKIWIRNNSSRTHFVLYYDGHTPDTFRIVDSWDGQIVNLRDRYGDPATIIQKFVHYHIPALVPAAPVAPPPAPVVVAAPPLVVPDSMPSAPTPPLVVPEQPSTAEPVSTDDTAKVSSAGQAQPSFARVGLVLPESVEAKQDAIVVDLVTLKPVEIIPEGTVAVVVEVVKAAHGNYLVTENMRAKGWGVLVNYFREVVPMNDVTGPQLEKTELDNQELLADGVDLPASANLFFRLLNSVLRKIHK